ncbi:MAG TPA: hypothetical protein VGX97_11635 [bacterium]|nr:hypothetical protein [bacterium]
MIDSHTLAAISLTGVVLDLLGGLYLAYDLLGGQHGPLRALTRTVTYTVLFGVSYGLPLGPRYGLVIGVGLGLALGIEFWLAAATGGRVPIAAMLGLAILRGAAAGLAAGLTFDARFGAAFGVFTILGLIVVYLAGFAPSQEYGPRFTRRRLVATCVRGVILGLAGALAGAATHESGRGLGFGLEIGVIVAMVGAVVALLSPFVELWADALPSRRLGALGAGLLLAGFALPSLQYWVTLLNVRVR